MKVTISALLRGLGEAGTAPAAGSRRAWVALGLVAAVWLIAWSKWLIGGSVVPWDSKNQFYAFFRFLADSLHAGTSPYWNPYHYGGHPSIADPQSLVLSPPFLLWAWLDRAPTLTRFDLIVFAHLLAGGLAFVGLGMRRGWPIAASLLAASIFMLGGVASSRLNHTGIILGYGLAPLALLLLEIALERRSFPHAIGFAVVGALIALERNQVALLLCLVLLAAFLGALLRSGDPRAWLRERAALLSSMAATGLLILTVPVLLTLQFAAHSNRPAVALGAALEGSLYPANLLSLLAPNVFGAHVPGFNYWGPQYSILPEVAATDDSFTYMFVGAVPVVLLLWLGVAGGRLAARGQRTVATILAIALLFSLGRYSPLFPLVFETVPGFALFRRPIDGLFIVTLATSLLAGQLLADFVRSGLPAASPFRLALVLSAAVALVASALSIASLTGNAGTSLIELARAAPVIAGVITVLAVTGARPPQARAMAASVLALIAVTELLVWNAASRLNAERREYYTVLEQARGEDAAALDLLASELERRQREGFRPRVEVLGLGGAWQNLALVHRLEATNGYNPLRIGLYDRLVAPGEATWDAGSRSFPPTFESYDCALARALGLEYVVLDRPFEQLEQLKRRPRAETLLAGPKVWVYRLPDALPRVRFSSRVELGVGAGSEGQAAGCHPPAVDRIVIDPATPPSAGPRLQAVSDAGGKAHIAAWSPDRIEIEVEAPAPGSVVLHDTYYPGWIAEVDGGRSPILRAEQLFRAVEVPAGRHRVVFRYAPLRLENLWVALGSALTLAVPRSLPRRLPTLVMRWRRRREPIRSRAAPGPHRRCRAHRGCRPRR